MARRELTRSAPLRELLRSRWPQLVVTASMLGGFFLVVAAGLLGTPVGNRNLATVGVWIAWWAGLLLVAVPLWGRAWCAVCPIGAVGDWIQRGAVLEPSARRLGMGRRWPRAWRNLWLQNATFAGLALSSVVILTNPRVTALVLMGLLAAAACASLLFERRAFCRYVCPLGGFIGLYASLAPVELRVKDRGICRGHRRKTCYLGSEAGAGCPWLVYPAALDRNTYCGLCLECLRTCPYGNVAVNRRPFGADLRGTEGLGLDEAIKALALLGTAITYAAVLLGPWGELKAAAYHVGSRSWLGYAAAYLGFVFGVMPGGFLLAVWLSRLLGRGREPVRRRFGRLAQAVVPLGLMCWMAFSLSFVLANWSYVWPVLSDPLGRGWDLVGTAGARWVPYLSSLTPLLQAGVLLLGLAWAAALVVQHTETVREAAPVVGYCLLVAVGLAGVLLG